MEGDTFLDHRCKKGTPGVGAAGWWYFPLKNLSTCTRTFQIKIIQRILEFLGMQASLDLVLRDTRALARSARVPQMRPKQKKRKLGVKKIHQNSLIRQRNPEILDSSYFSVSRPKDYNFDSWKEDLNKRIRDDMARDEQCRSVLESLSYPEL